MKKHRKKSVIKKKRRRMLAKRRANEQSHGLLQFVDSDAWNFEQALRRALTTDIEVKHSYDGY
jgi:hypothetical protein